jgi:hypothetical protein
LKLLLFEELRGIQLQIPPPSLFVRDANLL